MLPEIPPSLSRASPRHPATSAFVAVCAMACLTPWVSPALALAVSIDTALALATYNTAFGASRPKVLIAAADRWADTVTASALGGAKGWPVILVNRDAVPGQVSDYLRATSAAAVIVGGAGVVSNTTQQNLSRTVLRMP